MAKYDYWLSEDGLLCIKAWARDGIIDKNIAQKCGVAYSTFRFWKEKFPALSAALKEGKQVVDILVENALLKRALGYEYEETWRERVVTGFDHKTKKEKWEIVVTKVITKLVIPDVTAQIYWLKNRKRDMWKDSHDKVEIERERVEIEKKRLDMDAQQHNEGPKTINIIVDPDAEDWGD
ncbi:MAG: helix-turn-helix domain-containing protein [Candidatus Micrarchaeia archaeon]|jgi:hypothetical protein